MLDPSDDMSVEGIRRTLRPQNQVVRQVTAGLLGSLCDWRLAFPYLLPPLLVVVRLTVFIRKRAGTDFADVDLHAGAEVVLVMITCVIVAVSRQTKLVWRSVLHTSIGMLLVLYGFAALSAAWSVMPEYSGYRAVEYAGQFIAVIVGISCFTHFLRCEKAVLTLGLLVALLGVAGTARLTGLGSLHTNQYAAGASMVLCYGFAEIPRAAGRRRVMLVASAAVGLFIVALGTCATANVATCAGLLTGAGLTKNRVGLIALFLIAFILILATGLTTDFLDVATGVLFPGKSDSQIRGLSGRWAMWENTLAVASTHPFVGHGFGVQNRLGRIGITTHNLLVQIFLDTGAVGLAIFSIAMLMFAKEVLQRRTVVPPGLAGCVAALISALVHSLGLPIIGAQWLAPSFTLAAFAGLYVHWIPCATNHRLLYPGVTNARCVGR